MARKLYVTAMEPQSGKSVVALGLMELLSARVERLGFFRPIVPSADEPDAQIELIRRRYQLAAPYEQMHALSQDEAAAIPAYEELRKRVVEAYKQLEQGCDFVLCEGTDFTSATSALDYGLNADLANELGAPVLVVVKGGTTEETVASVRAARNSLAHKGCTIFGVVVNRVPPERVEELSRTLGAQDGSEPVYVLPELPELAFPTVGEIADELGAEILSDSTEEALQRDVRDVRVAAMSVEHFIDDLVDGTLVVVPGDRPDILVASLASTVSPAIPTVAGVLVTGGYPLSETVRRLLESAPFPVLNAEQPLHVAANVVQSVRPVIRAENERKIATALGVFESAVDTAELGQRIALERPPRMTPIMFEYELIERAKADRKHIVLPEGDDERVLRAAEILLRRGVVDLTILGDPKDVAARASAAGVDLGGALVVDPLLSPLRQEYANRYHELRKSRGMTEELALDVVAAPTYFGTMLVAHGAVDGMVSGSRVQSTQPRTRSGRPSRSSSPATVCQSSRACSSCASPTASSSTATALSIHNPTSLSSRTSRSAPPRRHGPSGSSRESRCCPTPPGHPGRARTSRSSARRRRPCANAGPTCSSRGRSSTTPPSTRQSPR